MDSNANLTEDSLNSDAYSFTFLSDILFTFLFFYIIRCLRNFFCPEKYSHITFESEFCVAALDEAIEKYGKPKIFNTDQGVQFTSEKFITKLTDNSIEISMDGKGRALDNVFIERFWRSLKQEKIYIIILNTVKEAKNAIADYMSFFNKERMHQSLEDLTPESVYFKKNIKGVF